MRARMAIATITVIGAGLGMLPTTGPAQAAATPAATSGATSVARTVQAPVRPAVVETRVIGHSSRGRPITAWRLGEPDRRTVVLVASMHGDEPAAQQLLDTLRDGMPIKGVDLWVVPRYNPDGLRRRTRQSATGVDLNRNYPYNWAPRGGRYSSGRSAGSEPETRAMMRFLTEIDPARVISFHQPLHGVDVDTKDRRFAVRLARGLRLPQQTFDCGGVCRGTMTGWFNHSFAGAAVTVEFSARPGRRAMTKVMPRRLLKVLGARWARERQIAEIRGPSPLRR